MCYLFVHATDRVLPFVRVRDRDRGLVSIPVCFMFTFVLSTNGFAVFLFVRGLDLGSLYCNVKKKNALNNRQ